jgi:hypothetical protein
MYFVARTCGNTIVSGYFVVKLHNLIIALFGLFLLTRCDSRESDDNHAELSSTANVTKVDNTLVGE